MPLAGTFEMDGLVQGSGIDAPDLDAWVTSAEKNGLRFILEQNGSSFSLLADNTPRNIKALGASDLVGTVVHALEALAGPAGGAHIALYSTLRSREFRPGAELQTVFLVGPDNKVAAQTREVAAVVEIPEPPKNTRRIAMQVLAGLGALALLGGISALFIDWPNMLQRARLITVPNQGVDLDAIQLEPFVIFKLAAVKQLDGYIRFTVTKGPQWDEAHAATLDDEVPFNQPGLTWRKFLALAAVKRGTARCCLYDEQGELVLEVPVALDALKNSNTFDLQTAIPRLHTRLKRVVIKP